MCEGAKSKTPVESANLKATCAFQLEREARDFFFLMSFSRAANKSRLASAGNYRSTLHYQHGQTLKAFGPVKLIKKKARGGEKAINAQITLSVVFR